MTSLQSIVVGYDLPRSLSEDTSNFNIPNTMQMMTYHDLDFCCVPLHPPTFQFFTSSSTLLRGQSWHKVFVGRPEVDVPAGEVIDPEVHHQTILDAVRYAAHHSLPSVLLPPVRRFPSPRYARTIAHITNVLKIQVWLMVPLGEWTTWNWVRTLCGGNAYLGVVPIVPAVTSTPQSARDAALTLDGKGVDPMLQRWFTEPLRAVYLEGKGSPDYDIMYPFIQRRHQVILQDTTQMKCVREMDGVAMEEKIRSHGQDSLLSMVEGFQDIVQCPLQPLQDNLESQTYEVFEKDTTKYVEYENAIATALTGFHGTTEVVVVMVLGAGRGPLVRCTLAAAERTGVAVKIYAIEKNMHAVLTLKAIAGREGWGPLVEIISTDFRQWRPPVLANVLVSELLGSFACNELSPECLQGAMRLMCPAPRGVCIPSRYSNTLCPIQSERIHASVRSLTTGCAKLETPYVVKLHSAMYLAKPAECFVFTHSGPQDPPDFNRTATVSFVIENSGLVHGFAGEFDCYLFGPHKLTTVKGKETPGLSSWFSCFFPLTHPILVQKGDVLTVQMWRHNNGSIVWYEWAMLEPIATPIHNVGGKHNSIGLIVTSE